MRAIKRIQYIALRSLRRMGAESPGILVSFAKCKTRDLVDERPRDYGQDAG